MKLWTTILTFILLGLVLTDCARKPVYTCGTGALMNRPSIQSKILSLKTVGIGDTIAAFISGTIFGKDSVDNKVTIDTLMFAAIAFISHERQDTVGAVSDMHGKFEKHLQAGTYDIIVKYVGYVGLMIKNVPFGQGELKEFDVLLGQQGQIIVESVVDAKKLNCSSYLDKNLNKQVYTFTDKMPEYGKGTADILTFFSKNFVYPKEQQDNFQGSIYISFIVDTDGQLKNIDVDKKYFGDSYSPVDLEAIRVFKLMPAWTPGQCNGFTVPVKIKIPIKF
jgi:hypothetical protein